MPASNIGCESYITNKFTDGVICFRGGQEEMSAKKKGGRGVAGKTVARAVPEIRFQWCSVVSGVFSLYRRLKVQQERVSAVSQLTKSTQKLPYLGINHHRYRSNHLGS